MKRRILMFTLLVILVFSFISTSNARGENEYYETTTMDVGEDAVNDIAFVHGKSTIMAVRVEGDLVIYGLEGSLLHRKEFGEELFCVAVSPDGTKSALGTAKDGNGSATMYVVSPINGEIV